MVVAAFAMQNDRMVDMDFVTVPYFGANNIILYKKPNPDDETITLFLKVKYN